MSPQSQRPTVILLQGPLGPFFADFAAALREQGVHTLKVNFNAGDRHYADADIEVDYEGSPEDWESAFTGLLDQYNPSAIICYGDMRFYHRTAKQLADSQNRPFWCFEEGYIRPGYSTFEPAGNNANSAFPGRFNGGQTKETGAPAPHYTPPVIRSQIWFAITYYAVMYIRFGGFERYAHHRPKGGLWEQVSWMRAGFRKLYHLHRDRSLTQKLIADHGGRLILVPLQVSVDTQIIYHSNFDTITQFIELVLQSAAQNLRPGDHIVIKHHPMDRGQTHYGQFIQSLVKKLNLDGRVTYAFDLILEDLVKATKACITINSTVSTLTLNNNIPTLCLGQSIVSNARLSSDQTLEGFWGDPKPVDSKRVAMFNRHLLAETQVTGSFYRDRCITAAAAAKKLCDALF